MSLVTSHMHKAVATDCTCNTVLMVAVTWTKGTNELTSELVILFILPAITS